MGETNASRLRRETRLQRWLPKTTLPHHRNCLGYTIKACLRRLKTLIFCAIDKNICLLIALKISINTWVQDVCLNFTCSMPLAPFGRASLTEELSRTATRYGNANAADIP